MNSRHAIFLEDTHIKIEDVSHLAPLQMSWLPKLTLCFLPNQTIPELSHRHRGHQPHQPLGHQNNLALNEPPGMYLCKVYFDDKITCSGPPVGVDVLMNFLNQFLSRNPRKDTYPQCCLQGCLKGYPRDRGRFMKLLIGGEFLSYPSLIGQLKEGYPSRHPLRHPFLGFQLWRK